MTNYFVKFCCEEGVDVEVSYSGFLLGKGKDK